MLNFFYVVLVLDVHESFRHIYTYRFCTVFVSKTFDILTYFNIMCEQHHRNSFNPF